MIFTPKNIFSVPGAKMPKGLRLSVEALTSHINALRVPIGPNYYDGFGKLLKPPVITTISAYFKDKNNFKSGELCPEVPVSPDFAQHISLCMSNKPAEPHAVALLHVGRKGCVAPLHFDWDHDLVLHACLRGTRTFYFLPPDAGWLLTPVLNTSSLYIPKLSGKDRNKLLKLLGGFEVTLKAGEAVLFPSMCWHSVYYDTASIGLSVRFSTRSDFRAFSILPRSWLLQRIVAELFCRNAKPAEVKRILDDCARAFVAPYEHWQARYKVFESACRRILLRMGKGEGAEQWADDAFVPELAIAGFEVEDLYTLPRQRIRGKELSVAERYFFPDEKQVSGAKRALARYAVAARRGLPAQRGLIPVQYEKDTK
jgi:hypothetical protein